MDKSEDLSKNIQNIKKRKNRDDITDHKTHTHIQRGNSHWHLRLSHCPLTQLTLTLLAKPKNDKYQEFNMQGLKNG